MARTVGRRPDDALVTEVHRRTGGNPFFVEQAARLWQSGGPVEAIAPGVRDAVQQRLSPLPEAAVPGRGSTADCRRPSPPNRSPAWTGRPGK